MKKDAIPYTLYTVCPLPKSCYNPCMNLFNNRTFNQHTNSSITQNFYPLLPGTFSMVFMVLLFFTHQNIKFE